MKKINRVGEKHITNEGYELEIIEYFNKRNCSVLLIEDNIVLKEREYRDIVKGRVKNPFKRNIYGIGFYGVGQYISKVNSVKQKNYQTWVGMLQRAYSEDYKNKYPTYKGCSVAEEWNNFQNFAEWFEENYIEGFVLDKDILVRGNKTYSPETCCFVPQEINALFLKNVDGALAKGINKRGNKFIVRVGNFGKLLNLGIYDTYEESLEVCEKYKSQYSKQIADKWKGQIDLKVYKAIYNYYKETKIK